jgi:hypothetical protein
MGQPLARKPEVDAEPAFGHAVGCQMGQEQHVPPALRVCRCLQPAFQAKLLSFVH